jgi:hypothetical protein
MVLKPQKKLVLEPHSVLMEPRTKLNLVKHMSRSTFATQYHLSSLFRLARFALDPTVKYFRFDRGVVGGSRMQECAGSMLYSPRQEVQKTYSQPLLTHWAMELVLFTLAGSLHRVHRCRDSSFESFSPSCGEKICCDQIQCKV